MNKKYISDNRRIILITGDNSKWYEQAIIIVRKDAAEKNNIDFVEEAEKIIKNYMNGISCRTPKTADVQPTLISTPKEITKNITPKNKKSTFDYVVNAITLISCVSIIFLVFGVIA